MALVAQVRHDQLERGFAWVERGQVVKVRSAPRRIVADGGEADERLVLARVRAVTIAATGCCLAGETGIREVLRGDGPGEARGVELIPQHRAVDVVNLVVPDPERLSGDQL